jgi:hypothetical protein
MKFRLPATPSNPGADHPQRGINLVDVTLFTADVEYANDFPYLDPAVAERLVAAMNARFNVESTT